jgi:hypothetical protein
MEDTNKTLALLLVAAIVVSLGGTIISLNKIGTMATVTGKATATSQGTTQLNITSDTKIGFTKSSINFGNGYVNNSCNNCTMWTNSTGTGLSSWQQVNCCMGGWKSIQSNTAQDGLWVRNQGNTNLTVNLNFSKTAATFIGGSSPAFQYRLLTDLTAGTCSNCGSYANDITASCASTLRYTTLAWYDANTSNPIVCATYGLTSDATKDEFVIDFKVIVPRTAPATAKTATVTVTGTSA